MAALENTSNNSEEFFPGPEAPDEWPKRSNCWSILGSPCRFNWKIKINGIKHKNLKIVKISTHQASFTNAIFYFVDWKVATRNVLNV